MALRRPLSLSALARLRRISAYGGMALRNLLGARRRTAFLATALVVVAFLFVLLFALTAGIRDGLLRAATSLSSGHVNVGGFYKTSPSDVSPLITDVYALRAELADILGPSVRVIARDRGWGKIVSDTASIQTGLVGVDIEQEPTLDDVISAADAWPGGAGDLARLAQPGTVALFEGQARRLRVEVGDQVTLRTETMSGYTNTVDAVVVFIAEDMGVLSAFSSLVPRSTIRTLYQLAPDTAGALQLYLDDIGDAEGVARRLRGALVARGHDLLAPKAEPFFFKMPELATEDWTGQKLDVTSWRDEVSFLTWILSALTTLSIVLLSILALIIAVGVMNTMWIAVRERTSEIGTLRAIGMRRGQVLTMFLLESLLLGAAAATLGALLGAAVALGVDRARLDIPVEAVRVILMSDALHLVVRPSQVALAAAALSLLVGISALWPASRAARIRPITAIQAME